MTSRGTILTARLTRAAAPMLLAALALSACSDDEPNSAPSTSTSQTPSTTATTPTTATTATPSITPTVTETASATPTPTPTKSTPPSSTPAPTVTPASCSASKAGAANTKGMSAAAAAKAKKILTAAKACDAKTLITLANADSTGMAGEKAPSAIFTSRLPQNFVALATLLTMEPTETFDGTIQPKVFSERYAQDDAEWNKVVAAGLLTKAAATKMRQDDGAYTGYRAGIASDGTWTFFTSGR
ncbi:hypothetical protein ACOCJ7_03175 [Knoellia sp. CPCC 206453]|uniref:hypothetical protein n=1 Tax=Knoellia pratensis TaxID=3404796 RepID=UPI003620B581